MRLLAPLPLQQQSPPGNLSLGNIPLAKPSASPQDTLVELGSPWEISPVLQDRVAVIGSLWMEETCSAWPWVTHGVGIGLEMLLVTVGCSPRGHHGWVLPWHTEFYLAAGLPSGLLALGSTPRLCSVLTSPHAAADACH